MTAWEAISALPTPMITELAHPRVENARERVRHVIMAAGDPPARRTGVRAGRGHSPRRELRDPHAALLVDPLGLDATEPHPGAPAPGARLAGVRRAKLG